MKKKAIILSITAAAILILLAGIYLGIGMHYMDHFFEHTAINGIDVSDKTVQEAEAAIAARVEDYQITLVKKDGSRETISGQQIGYHFVSGGEAQQFLEAQNLLLWLPRCLGEKKDYTMTAATSYEESLLRQEMLSLNCFDETQVTNPADAYLEKQEDGTYRMIGEVEGNRLNQERVFELLKQAVAVNETELNLAGQDCYEKPSLYADDPGLNQRMEVYNRYAEMQITYYMGGEETVTLDGSTISGWMTLNQENQPVFDYEAVQAYVAQLAANYDTIGTWEPFYTSLGETVYVEARTYGWQINQDQETEELYQILLIGQSAERSPVYYESAGARGENDIGSTYVEVDYTNQRMWYYKDGQLLVDTPVVTGCVANGTESPEGIFCLVGKSEDEVLKGEGYATPVEYWMPFYGGVGIHDADSWRGSSYGGTIYQYSGSHGCINTPTANAALIYENIEVGTPIICYKAGVTSDSGPETPSGTTEGTEASGTFGEDGWSDGNTQGNDGSDVNILGDTGGEITWDGTWEDSWSSGGENNDS